MAEKARLTPAFWAGFKLIGREPLAVVVWGVIYLVLTVGPMLLFFGVMGGGLMDYYRDIAASAGAGAAEPPPAPPVFAAFMPLIQLLQIVTGILAAALIYAAIYRAVLRPAQRGFAYLRLSAEEFNLGVVVVVLYILFAIALFVGVIVLAIPFGIVGALGLFNSGGALGVGALATVAVMLAMLAASVPAIRLAMALPMTIADRRIRIFEAWTFTRGYSWRLLGLALLQLIVIFVLYSVIGAVVIGGMVSVFGSLDNISPETIFSQAVAPMLLLMGLVWVALSFVAMPILMAPWADAYQRIAVARGEDDNAVFD